MKHATSRFFRFFLVAALVAAMVGSLLPAKVAGIAATDISATVSPGAAGEASAWTITFTTEGVIQMDDGVADNGAEDDSITLTFTGASLTVVDDDGTAAADEWREGLGEAITVTSGDASGNPTVTAATATTITFNTPITIGTAAATGPPAVEEAGAEATITITAAAGITHDDPAPATTSVEVAPEDTTEASATASLTGANAVFKRATPTSPTRLNAGQVARWDVTTNNVATAIVRDQHEIMVSFTSGTVPSSIDKNAIRLIASTAPAAGAVRAGSPALAPSISGKTIRFVSPVDVDAGDTLRVIVSEAAGIAAQGQPGMMAIVVRAGESNARMTSAAVSVGAFLRISPTSGPRGTTVTVTGGGFTANTAGKLQVDGNNVGDYTVDSAGKLTGSFVATSSTSGGGAVSVVDLGRGGDAVMGSSWTQTPSASPASTSVTRGSSVSVTLSDFPGSGDYTATIGGEEGDFFTTQSNTRGTLVVPQGQGTGTKQVVVSRGGGDARFLITIGSRTLVVSPSSAVPGQAITVSGAGFNGIATVDLTLSGAAVDGGDEIRVNTDGTFLYTGRVPFTTENASKGSKTWTASGMTTAGAARAASSSGFTIQERSITLSPSTANPGATVEVYGTGWGVRTQGNATSQVTLEIKVTGTNPKFGPFPISSTGEFTGALTVPSDTGVTSLTITATDNNGTNPLDATLTQGFPDPDTTDADDGNGNQTASKRLMVPQGVISVSPSMASTGSVITVTGSGFPAQTNLSALSFGDGNALPVPAPATDVSGNFVVTLTVPAAAQGGSLPPGAVVITARVGQISGTTSFTIPGPSITLSADAAAPGQMITVSGMNFGAYANVGTINVGVQNQAPTPNPLTDGTGNFSAQVLIPALNPGAYTITVRTAAAFTATASINIVSQTAGGVSPEVAFQALTSRGLLTLAAAAAPGGTSFGAYVPDLAGNTLVQVEPNGVLILTLNADARISVSNQPAVDVKADTPTFFALGSSVSVEVIE
jgi:hypothetical protein